MDFLSLKVKPLYQHAFPGTAVCDWLPHLRTDLVKERPKVVVLAFAGNNLTPCMRPGGRVLSGTQLVAKYRNDAQQVLGYTRAAGAQLVLVRTPIADPRWQQFNITGDADVIRYWTLVPGTWLVDGGRYLNPGGIYRPYINDQSTHVPDGLHLTPFGSSLYAQAISDGLTRIGLVG